MPLDPTLPSPAARAATPSLRLRIGIAVALLCTAPVSPPEYVETTGDTPASRYLAPIFNSKADSGHFFLN